MRPGKLKKAGIRRVASGRSFSFFRTLSSFGPDELLGLHKNHLAVVGPPHLRTLLGQDVSSSTGCVYLSVGVLLDIEMHKRSAVANLAEELQEEGTNLPAMLVSGLLKRRVTANDCLKAGWVMDGFPTTAKEMEYMIRFGIAPECVLVMTDPSMSRRAKREATELIQRFPGIVTEVNYDTITWELAKDVRRTSRAQAAGKQVMDLGLAYSVLEEDLPLFSPQMPRPIVPEAAAEAQSAEAASGKASDAVSQGDGGGGGGGRGGGGGGSGGDGKQAAGNPRRRSMDDHHVREPARRRHSTVERARPRRVASDTKVFDRLARSHTQSSLQRERRLPPKAVERRNSRRGSLESNGPQPPPDPQPQGN